MANEGKTTSVAFIGIVLGAVLVYVMYRLMALEKQLREVKASQSVHIQELIQEHIESALASALLEESAVPPAAELKPAVTMRIPVVATAIHEVFNSGDISQFIAAAPRPAAKPSKMTVEEVVEEPVKVVQPKPAEPPVEPAKPVEAVKPVVEPAKPVEPVEPAKPVEPPTTTTTPAVVPPPTTTPPT